MAVATGSTLFAAAPGTAVWASVKHAGHRDAAENDDKKNVEESVGFHGVSLWAHLESLGCRAKIIGDANFTLHDNE